MLICVAMLGTHSNILKVYRSIVILNVMMLIVVLLSTEK